MLIDFHCHTIKVKIGDKKTREVDKEKFSEKILEAGVEIVAITNHKGLSRKVCKFIKLFLGSRSKLPFFSSMCDENELSIFHVFHHPDLDFFIHFKLISIKQGPV